MTVTICHIVDNSPILPPRERSESEKFIVFVESNYRMTTCEVFVVLQLSFETQ